jgi:class 3 adenylate cyclase
MTLPQGTVTFLRSDIEGSMDLVRALGARYDDLNAEHQGLVRTAVANHSGQVVRTEGDAFFIVFTDAAAAARAAVDIQLAMGAHPWPEEHPFKLRIGIHVGVATRAGDDERKRD